MGRLLALGISGTTGVCNSIESKISKGGYHEFIQTSDTSDL